MQTFVALVISIGLGSAVAWMPLPGIWWDVVRWAFYLPILMAGASHGSWGGLFAGLTASVLYAIAVYSRGMSEVTWAGILTPDFALVGLLGSFMKNWPRFRKLYSAGEADPWPALVRISGAEIALDLSPLASIESAARLLEEADASVEMRQELVGIIVRECNHLSASVTGLLQHCREVLPPGVCESDIAGIVEAAVEEAQFVLSDRGIVFSKSIAPGVPPIYCNRDQIRNLFMSLIMNTAQSAATGTAVVLDVRPGENGVILAVKGQESFAKRAAMRFLGFRPRRSTVGLAAAQDIVRWHGGRIKGSTNLEKGLAFSVWLPLRRNDINGTGQGASCGGRR